MYHYEYQTENTCSRLISFDLDDNVVHNIYFKGGCNGNLQTISRLLDGWTVEEIEEKLGGIICKGHSTSCSDQLAKAVRQGYESFLSS